MGSPADVIPGTDNIVKHQSLGSQYRGVTAIASSATPVGNQPCFGRLKTENRNVHRA